MSYIFASKIPTDFEVLNKQYQIHLFIDYGQYKMWSCLIGHIIKIVTRETVRILCSLLDLKTKNNRFKENTSWPSSCYILFLAHLF